MNQILFTNNKDNRVQTNKTVKVFCIIIIIFALVLIGQGVIFLIKNSQNRTIISDTRSANEPKVIANAEGSNVNINIKHNVAIRNVYYSWKDGEENEIQNINGNSEITGKLLLPNEDTTLNLRIIDENNIEFKYNQEFKYNESIDLAKPSIFLASVNGKVLIRATDDRGLSYIEYNWNNEEKTKIEAEEDQKTKMEHLIEVREGKNKLTVVAFDASGNFATEEKEIIPVTKPVIELKKSKGEIIIRVSDEEEVTEVEYEINGTKYTKKNNVENKKIFEIRDLLNKGENIIKVTAHNRAGLTSEKIGKCQY